MAPKRTAPPNAFRPLKRQKNAKPVEEIVFDPAARIDFITGFHKRKLERTRRAQEAAAKKERAQKLQTRKLMREERAKDIERHTQAVNEALAKIERSQKGESAWSDSEDNEWEGIPEPEKIEYEDEYLDEDRHTVVTVEEVDPSKQGLRRIADGTDGESEPEDIDGQEEEIKSNGTGPAKSQEAMGKRSSGPKKKRKNFRYESRAERMLKKSKERESKRPKSKVKRARKPLK